MKKENEETEKEIIVVATDSKEKILYLVGKIGMTKDEIEIRYTNKYTPVVEFIVVLLRRSFGWIESDRGYKEVTNKRCAHAVAGFCGHKDKDKKIKCTDMIRRGCDTYKAKFTNKFTVNFILIEKRGAIKGIN